MKKLLALLWALAALALVGSGVSAYATYRTYATGGKGVDPLFWVGTVVVGIAAWSMICIARREGLVPKPDAKQDQSGDSN